MELNIKYILIGAVIIMLMVAFGNNPVENARKEEEEAKKGKDPLMESIREFNEKNPNGAPGDMVEGTGGSAYFSGGGADYQPSGSPDMPGYMYQGGEQPTLAPQYPSQPADTQPAPVAPAQPASPNNYYPPTAPR